jgi:LysM repeat protein
VNREQKIALIIGFAVVLVVGVLVSDHWSGARQLEIADATEGDSGRIESGPIALLPDPGVASTRLAAGPASEKAEPYEPQNPRLLPDEIVSIRQGENRDTSPLGDALQFASTEPEQPTHDESWRQSFTKVGERMAKGIDGGLPVTAELETADVRPIRRSNRQAGVQTASVEVPTSQPIRHTVAKNESLYKVAEKYLGDGNRWREIAAANRGKVGADGGVRSGVTLVIPNATRAGSRNRTVTPKPQIRRPATSPELSKRITYTVAKNDSLGEISERFLGTSRRMRDIIRANPGKIDDPNDIRVGMVLTIPARP